MSNTKYSNIDDQELVRLYKLEGNQEIVAELFLRYKHLVFGTSMKYVKDSSSAEDCSSMVYEAICKDLLKYDIKHFKSWLYMVTKNICLKGFRKGQTEKKHIDLYSQDQDFVEFQDNQDLNNRVLKEENLNKLEDCLEKLKDKQKESIKLFYLNEMTYQDIDDQLKLGLKKIKSYIQNGKRNLKICMEK